MPQQGRLGDKSMVPADAHGCPACPHTCVGPAVAGSPDVMVNDKPALRIGDPGVHSACCGPNTWVAQTGAPAVYINGRKAHRLGDVDAHCGGSGKMIEGSPNVIVGDQGGGGKAGNAKPEPTGCRFEGGFKLVCEITGVELDDVPYEIRSASGKKVSGRCLPGGLTQLLGTEAAEGLDLLVLDPDTECGH